MKQLGVITNPKDITNKEYVDTELSTKVDLTSAQTISGVKTFSNSIKIGSATLTYSSDDSALILSFS